MGKRPKRDWVRLALAFARLLAVIIKFLDELL
jgi:hypothetical protein